MRESRHGQSINQHRRISFSEDLKDAVYQSNTQNRHKVSDERKYGNLVPYGSNGLITSITDVSNNSQKLSLQRERIYDSKLPETVFYLMEKEQNITQYILNP